MLIPTREGGRGRVSARWKGRCERPGKLSTFPEGLNPFQEHSQEQNLLEPVQGRQPRVHHRDFTFSRYHWRPTLDPLQGPLLNFMPAKLY